MSIWRKKDLAAMLADAEGGEKSLKRSLGAFQLVALGVGAIIGAGLFVRTAAAAAEASGNGVTLSFVVAAIGCAFAGLCYAEFAAMIPISGSAYAYSFVTMGELVAWIIGWALVMEYALGAATVSIAWSEYLNNLFGGSIPYEWCHSPFESIKYLTGEAMNKATVLFPEFTKSIHHGKLVLSAAQLNKMPGLANAVQSASGIINAPALIILC